MFTTAQISLIRTAAAFVVLLAAIVLVAPLSMLNAAFPADNVAARALLFYAITAGAYGFLPFVRRGDIVMVGMWLVLAVGVAPCFAGRELSASCMFADMAGVLMSAIPIYIARFRQVAQGDLRQYRRRGVDAAL